MLSVTTGKGEDSYFKKCTETELFSVADMIMLKGRKLSFQGHGFSFFARISPFVMILSSEFQEVFLKGLWRPASGEICMQVRKQQLELDVEQQTGSKLGKEYVSSTYSQLRPVVYPITYLLSSFSTLLLWRFLLGSLPLPKVKGPSIKETHDYHPLW